MGRQNKESKGCRKNGKERDTHTVRGRRRAHHHLLHDDQTADDDGDDREADVIGGLMARNGGTMISPFCP